MRSRALIPLLVVAVLFLTYHHPTRAQSSDPSPATQEADHAIQPYSEPPWYWAYEGEPVVLVGGSDDDNLFQWTGEELTAHLDLLASVGGNYVRNTMSDRDEGDVYAFASVGDGQYDLDQWNDAYWDRLSFFLQETSRRDIIVQLTLWDHFDMSEAHPWHPASNVNYGPEVMDDEDDFYGGSVYDDNEAILAYQQRYIDKLLSISLQYGNVLYNINNEGSQRSTWDNYWASYIKEKAEAQDRAIYVTSMKFDPSSSVRHALTYRDLYAYAEISQNNQDSRGGRGPAHYANIMDWRAKLTAHPMPMNNVKIYGAGVGQNYSAGTGKEAVARFWRNIFAGSASSRFHRPEGNWGIGLDERAQTTIKAMSMFLEAFDVFEARPHPDLLSSYVALSDGAMEAYCLADIGTAYAIYFPEGRYTVDLDPWVFVDSLRVRWLDVDDGTWSEEEIRPVEWTGGLDQWGHRGRVRLTTPGNESYVALLEVVETEP
jgi:hypothetical protein